MNVALKHALISVSDKTGLAEFAQGLAKRGIKIFSTGGTRQYLLDQGLEVEDVSAYTGFPEMMDGRVKTLHPKIHAGILCRHDRSDDMAALAAHGIVTFELVVVNLYPFESTIARPDVTDKEAIEQIDIGGPSLIRAAAKNHAFTAVATSACQYADILETLDQTGGATSLELRRKLAASAFAKTAAYDQAIAQYFAKDHSTEELFPASLTPSFNRQAVLRYGENPHQQAAVYQEAGTTGASLITGKQLSGKELSYNNLLDLDSALSLVKGLPGGAAAAVIKHNNPCGAASAPTLAQAMRSALDGDPVSAFGSVIAVNTTLDAATAEVLVEPNRFVEAIVAPEFEASAVEILTTRPKWKANVRLMQVGDLNASGSSRQYRQIAGGLLVQEGDCELDPEAEWKVVTEVAPSDAVLDELRFAWAAVRHVKSNAILISKEQAICGVGAGQMSRVDSVEISIKKSGDKTQGAVLASDAFFPFADSIEHAAAAGIVAIIQPGGSRRDDEVIAACNQHGIAMIFTGRRHFKH